MRKQSCVALQPTLGSQLLLGGFLAHQQTAVASPGDGGGEVRQGHRASDVLASNRIVAASSQCVAGCTYTVAVVRGRLDMWKEATWCTL